MKSTLLQDRRVWIGGSALVALLLVAATWLLLIGPKLDSASDLQSQAEDAQVSNQQVQTANNKLRDESEHLSRLQDKLRAALDGLPSDNGFDSFTTEVTSLAAKNGITLTTISINPPAAQGGTTTAPADSSGGDTGTPAAADPAAASAGSVLTIDVTLTTTGSGARQNAFLSQLQYGDRRVVVTSSQLSVASQSRVNSINSVTSMTTQLTMFTAPMSAEQIKAIEKDLAAS